jgi:hypothetical protein
MLQGGDFTRGDGEFELNHDYSSFCLKKIGYYFWLGLEFIMYHVYKWVDVFINI